MSLSDEASHFVVVDAVSELYEDRLLQLTEENARLRAALENANARHPCPMYEEALADKWE